MKKIFIAAYLFSFNYSFSQINPSDTVNVDVLDEIKSSSYVNLGINLFDLNLSGSHMYFGSGASLDLVNIKNKFNFFSTFVYNYGVYKYTGGSNNPLTNQLPEVSNFIDVNVGYTFSQKDDKRSQSLFVTGGRIKKQAVKYFVHVDSKCINSQMIRAGYYSLGQINSGETYIEVNTGPNSYFSISDYSIFHQLNCLQVGYVQTRAVKSSYNILKYGKRFDYEERTRYIDLLISLPSDLPTLSPTYQNEIATHFSKLPVGLRIGVKNINSSDRRKAMILGSKLEMGVNPGFYSGIRSMGTLFYFKMGLTVNLFKALK